MLMEIIMEINTIAITIIHNDINYHHHAMTRPIREHTRGRVFAHITSRVLLLGAVLVLPQPCAISNQTKRHPAVLRLPLITSTIMMIIAINIMMIIAINITMIIAINIMMIIAINIIKQSHHKPSCLHLA